MDLKYVKKYKPKSIYNIFYLIPQFIIMERVAQIRSTLAERLQGRFIDKEYNGAVVIRTGDTQIDNIGFVTLTSKIVWTNENQYNLILEEISDENAELGIKIGDVMNVTVTEVNKDFYIANCAFNNQQVVTKLWFD